VRASALLLVLVVSATVTAFVARPAHGAATVLPSGFNDAEFVRGLDRPTAMEFAPDGRLFVLQKAGGVRVIEDGELLDSPFVRINVDGFRERGLLGIAFDPDFATNQYVYLYYTSPVPQCHNQVSRFTADGNVAVPGSEVVLLDIGNCGSGGHNAGAIHFGMDGKLYVAVGEQNIGANSQKLTNLFGKLLRINPDGTIPTGNPFYNVAEGRNRAIWALGLRNPFTFAVQPGTGRTFINDVGAHEWEEINDGIAGSNYGWPETEGVTSDPRFRSPIFAYPHTGLASQSGCAITGGTFYNPPVQQFPASYAGDYFFADYCNGWIRKLDPAAGNAVTGFLTGASTPVDLKVGADGSLYYLTRSGGPLGSLVHKVSHSNLPAIFRQPTDLTVLRGATAKFNVTPSGDGPRSFRWQRNGVNIPGATSSAYSFVAALADDGATFRCIVTNPNGSVTSKSATLSVNGDAVPTATITGPVHNSLWNAGDTISFSGTGTDPEDGDLPASAFTWEVLFHHDTHTHPFLEPFSGVRNGTFTIPDSGHTESNIWYRIHLTVTDSAGGSDSTFVDIKPRKALLTFTSSPNNLQFTLDDVPHMTPYSELSVVGMRHDIEALTPQTLGGVTYAFEAWSDGGLARHEIVTPLDDRTYSASYIVTSNLLANGGFEVDADGDNKPDNWTLNRRATRSSAVVHSGGFAVRHFSRDDTDYATAQTVRNVTAGTAYDFSGWVNIPSTSDVFSFAIEVRWRNAANEIIGATPVARFDSATSSWTEVTRSVVAPAGTDRANVRMVVGSLNATLYADDFLFRP
jgi:glucose/arabinose dehydrogenase